MKTGIKHSVFQSIRWAFITLWVMTICIKLYDIDKTRGEMRNQVFPVAMADVLVWFIPALSAGITILLLSNRKSVTGVKASLVLLGMFSLYILLGMNNVFGRIPCSCGGILPHSSYHQQLLLNLAFIFLAIIGIWLNRKEVKVTN